MQVIFFVAVALIAGSTVQAQLGSPQCLRQQTPSWSIETGTSAVLSFYGCFTASAIQVDTQPNVNDTKILTRFNESYPLNFTLTCAAFCLESFSPAQFAVTDAGACRCLFPKYFITARANTNFSAPCESLNANSTDSNLRVFAATPSCPINVSLCGGVKGCTATDGCCVPQGSGDDEPNSIYMAMVQWCVAIILIMAVVEAIVYSVLRYRYRGADTDEAMRSKEDATTLGERLLATFPPVSAAAIGNEQDACVVCLEDLAVMPSQRLPCGHVLHTHCLKDYLSHELTQRSVINCPTCRSRIADDSSL